ncbi:SDR family oxidoreductase [Kribbella turkmenica]|uniref:SDR family oxidoreductase n=1 Tax=Kribbella turkmenica TaxID=2530375 RepID=A0A4R4XGN8_9ACTN|nr:SDR family NAD(P)-dependent oxidoreductase [Kribbella turkmenica]TDD30003.1 SDR family oxidoreductase [Kribbella turkmenica]
MRYTGRRAIVTGAASGIGEGTAKLLASEGAQVVLADVNGDGISAAAEQIGSAGGKASALWADVSDAKSVENLINTAAHAMGGLDTVINVAGIQRSAPVAETDPDSWDQQFAVNVRSVFLTAKYAVPHLRAAGGGQFVSVASIAALKGISGLTAYSASKGAIVSFTRTLAVEVAADNIRVLCLCPGWVDTPFNDPVVTFMGGEAAHQAMVAAEVPLARQGRPSEMAEALAFLASDAASYMTGQALIVDGGITS